MDLRDVWLALRRHWLIALIVFDLFAAVGLAAGVLPDKSYSARATALTSSEGENIAQTNYNVSALVSLAQSRALREDAAQRVDEQFRGPDAPSVSIDAQVSGPEIQIITKGEDPQALAEWANAVMFEVVEQNDFPAVNLVAQDTADVPTNPDSPRPVPTVAASVILGVIAATFAAMAASRLRVALDSAEDIRRRVGTSVVGEIPSVRALKKSRSSVLELLEDGNHSLINAFQRLRTNVEFRMVGDRPRTIAVASFNASEGKSTVAAGLAWSLGAVGHRVHLVDADLRRPRMHHIMSVAMGQGVSDLGYQGAKDLLQPTLLPNVSLLPAGLPHGRPADVVSVVLRRAIDELAEDGSIVIVDSPPIHQVAETEFVLGSVAHVLLVVDTASVQLPELAAAVTRLRESGAEPLGVVINRTRRRRARSEYYSMSEAIASPNGAGDITPTRRNLTRARRREGE